MNNFTPESYAAFEEAALEKYDFGSCKDGEKMTFGKCQKVGGSSKKKEVPSSLKQSKATAEAQLASAKKRGNKPQQRKAEKALASVNAKIDAYSASEEEAEFASSACPKGEKMTFGKCQKVGESKDEEVATSRVSKSLNRLDNQRRRSKGLSPKYSKKGYKK